MTTKRARSWVPVVMVPRIRRVDPFAWQGLRGAMSPMLGSRWFAARQVLLIVGAIAAYFGVRGLTEGQVATAEQNARRVLDVERFFGIAVETAVQDAAAWSELLVNLGNWVYIWAHWPVIIGTLVWFAWRRRGDYFVLRNAIFISGAIGLVIFANFPVAPPRLFSAEFVDTVSLRSNSYRVLQPPAFTNKYAAVPSFHFGWNMLVGIAWYQAARGRWWRWAGVVMPVAMAWAVVVTGNHWVIDIAAGGVVALVGLAAARWWRARSGDRRWTRRVADDRLRFGHEAVAESARTVDLSGDRVGDLCAMSSNGGRRVASSGSASADSSVQS